MTAAACTSRVRLELAYDDGYFCLIAGRERTSRASIEEGVGQARSTPLRLAQGPGHLLVLSPHLINVAATVTVESWDGETPDDRLDWQEVCEAGMDVDVGGIEFYSPPLAARLPAPPPGRYVVRVCGRGFRAHGWAGSTAPGDTWRLQFWPSAASSPPRRIASWSGPVPGADLRTRVDALRALLEADLPADPPAELLQGLRPVEDPAVRAVAVHVLASGWATNPAVTELLRGCAIDDPDPLARLEAVTGLTRASRQAATDAVLRDRATRDTDAQVRAGAVAALARVDPDDPTTLRWLRTLAAGADLQVRGGAVRALGYGRHRDSDTLEWLRTLADDPGCAQRWDAFTAIGTGWGGEQNLLDWLYHHVRNGDQHTAGAALRTLTAGWAGDPEVLAVLQGFADSGPAPARGAARAAIHRGWGHDPLVRAWLQERLATAEDQIMEIPLGPCS